MARLEPMEQDVTIEKEGNQTRKHDRVDEDVEQGNKKGRISYFEMVEGISVEAVEQPRWTP